MEANNVINIFKNEFMQKLKSTLIWAVLILAVLFMYMLLYPMVKEIIGDKFEAMPEELLQVIGAGQQLNFNNYNLYFGVIYQVILVALCCYAVYGGANILDEEEKTNSIEFLYAQRVSRIEIFIGKLFTVLINCTIIIFAGSIAIIISGLAVAKTDFDFGAIINTIALTSISIYFFVFLGFFIATIVKKNMKASSVGLGVLFGMYLIGYLGQIVGDKLSFTTYFSPIHIVNANEIINSSYGIGNASYSLIPILVLGILYFVLIICSIKIYKKKDF